MYLYHQLLSHDHEQFVLQQRGLDESGWCITANKLRWLPPFWTLALCSLKDQHCQELLELVYGANLCVKIQVQHDAKDLHRFI